MGLDKEQISKIINKELDKNADLLIGIDDPELNQLINVLTEAFSLAIAENNSRLEGDIQEMFRI
jgi:hypothetical protein